MCKSFATTIVLLSLLIFAGGCGDQTTSPARDADSDAALLSNLDVGDGATAQTVTVSPSGDMTGESDWANIMAAFQQAVVAGAGATVQFTAGDFYVHRPIQVANFSGTVSGAGKGTTNLRTAPGVLFQHMQAPLPPFPVFMVLYLDDTWPSAQEANITISDMTFRIEGPTEPWGSHDPANEFNLMNVVDIVGRSTGVVDHELTHLNVSFEHLEAIGVEGPEYLVFGLSINHSFTVGGEWIYELHPSGVMLSRWIKPITGTYNWKDINGENSRSAVAAWSTQDSQISIGGSPQDGIMVRNGTGFGVAAYLDDISNSTVEVSYVETYDRTGILLYQGQDAVFGNDLGELVPETMPDISNFLFHHNIIRPAPGGFYGCIELANYGGYVGQKTTDVVISRNTLYGTDLQWGPIYTEYLYDTVIRNNSFRGNGPTAMALLGTNMTVLGDNVQNWETSPSLALPAIAPIWLTPWTWNVTVVGGSNQRNVFDQGFDNVLVGVNNMHVNIGQDISEAMQLKSEIMRSMPR